MEASRECCQLIIARAAWVDRTGLSPGDLGARNCKAFDQYALPVRSPVRSVYVIDQ